MIASEMFLLLGDFCSILRQQASLLFAGRAAPDKRCDPRDGSFIFRCGSISGRELGINLHIFSESVDYQAEFPSVLEIFGGIDVHEETEIGIEGLQVAL